MGRFSIRALMSVIVVSAVGLAALRNANELWAGAMLCVALAALGVAVLGGIFLRGREQAWWLGFVVIGSGYLIASLGPTQPQLGATPLLSYVQSLVSALHVQGSVSVSTILVETHGPPGPLYVKETVLPATANSDQFLRVGHCLFALLAGLAGGTIARSFYTRRQRAEEAAG
jgi:hypothetical protein